MRTTDNADFVPTGEPPIPRSRVVLTVEQAAEALGIGRTLMYELVGSGAVESVRIGRLRRVPAQALRTYVDGLRATSAETGS